MKIAKSTSSVAPQVSTRKVCCQGQQSGYGLAEHVNQKLTAKLNDAFILGKERTEQQDVEFPINQLVVASAPFLLLSMIRSLPSGVLTDLASGIL